LAVDVRHGGELFEAGWIFPGDDEIVKARRELFANFSGGHRELVRVREALERAEFQEAARQRAQDAPPPPPAPPPRVVCIRPILNAGRPVEVGSVFLQSDTLVSEQPGAFAAVIET
jgi:hypothetical protein